MWDEGLQGKRARTPLVGREQKHLGRVFLAKGRAGESILAQIGVLEAARQGVGPWEL